MTSLIVVLAAMTAAQDAGIYSADGIAEAASVGLAGSASYAPEGLTLTPDRVQQAGSAFWSCPLSLGLESSFEVALTFTIGGDQGTNGADGIAFVIQASAMGPAALGNQGGELAFGGVAPGVGVEFDTWRNEHEADDNHVGVVTSASPGTHLGTRSSQVFLNFGQTVFEWMYDAD